MVDLLVEGVSEERASVLTVIFYSPRKWVAD
jgi:hypothetical protein